MNSLIFPSDTKESVQKRMQRNTWKSPKISLALLTLIFLLCIPFAVSHAEALKFEDLNKIEVGKLTLEKKSFTGISGKVEISNPLGQYFPDLYVATELYLKLTANSSNLINSKFYPIELVQNEKREFKFEHDIPFGIPAGTYDFSVRLYTRTGVGLALESVILSSSDQSKEAFGGNTDAFLIISPEKSSILVDGKEYDELSGPNVGKGESPTLSLVIQNVASSPLKVIPVVKVYERNESKDAQPVIVKDLSPVEFKGNEAKNIKLELPAMSKSESYYAKITLLDATNRRVLSGEYRAKYVVKGEAAKILSHNAKIENGQLLLNSYLIGAPDGSSFKNAILRTTMYREGQETPLETKTANFDPGPKESVINTGFYLVSDASNYKVVSEIIYAGNVLDKTTVKYDTNRITNGKGFTAVIPPSASPSVSSIPDAPEQPITEESKGLSSGIIFLIILLVLAIVLWIYFWRKSKQ